MKRQSFYEIWIFNNICQIASIKIYCKTIQFKYALISQITFHPETG